MVEFSSHKHHLLHGGAGIDISIKEYTYKAAKNGASLYIQAGLHGGETSQWALYRLHDFLLKNLDSGTVHIILFANPLAWLQRCYNTTIGKFSFIDGKDYNRYFLPNSRNDEKGLLSQTLLKIAASCDFVVDLHTSQHSVPFVIYTQKKYENWVKLCNIKYNQYSDDANINGLENTFNAALDRNNIPNLCIECGSHDKYNETQITQVYNALLHIMQNMKLIDSSIAQSSEQVLYKFTKFHKIIAPASGLIRFLQEVGNNTKATDIIASIAHADDICQTSIIKSDSEGVIIKQINTHTVWQGDIIASIATDLQKL